MKSNKFKEKAKVVYTHGGASASAAPTNDLALRRAVLTCMLWEDQYYESGISIADRIKNLIPLVEPYRVCEIACEAREQMKLRHVPLLIASHMAKLHTHRTWLQMLLPEIIQRADELAEFIAIYAKVNNVEPSKVRPKLSAQVKRGLAKAFPKFSQFDFAKYKRDNSVVELRDAMFLSHPKPVDGKVAEKHLRVYKNGKGEVLRHKDSVFYKIANRTLGAANTHEVRLSAGEDKAEVFSDLIATKKLGALALLRNLRNMKQSGISKAEAAQALLEMKTDRVLPFRFISAARAVPEWEDIIEPAMFNCLADRPVLPGKTILIVDTSGSMHSGRISSKSDLTRVDAAVALAILMREICEDVSLYATAGNDSTRVHATTLVPSRRGFGLGDALFGAEMRRKIGGGGIFLKQCMDYVYAQQETADRIIVLTDEQDCDLKANPKTANAFGKKNYIVNLASYKHGVSYDKWFKIDGWSEAIIDYIVADEALDQQAA